MLALRHLQGELKKAVQGLNQVPQALSMIQAAPPLSAEERLQIYADGFWLRQLDSLGSDYRLARLILGEERFAALVKAYLKAHPSRTTTLSELGRLLPEFLSSKRRVQRLSPEILDVHCDALRDVILLEWLAIECFYSEVKTENIPAQIALVPPERLGEVQFQLSPCLRRIKSRVRLDRLWVLASAESKPAVKRKLKLLLQAGPKREYLTWRKGFAVQVRELSPAEGRLLSQIEQGVCFGALRFPKKLQSPGGWERIFGSWVEDGVLVALSLLA